eukprot:gene18408-21958_t
MDTSAVPYAPSSDVPQKIEEMIRYRSEHIDGTWRKYAGGLGDESCELKNAVDAANEGLAPLRQIAALPDTQQDQVVEALVQKGLSLDKLYDDRLFDDAAAACERVKLVRELKSLATPWAELWQGVELVNALSEPVSASKMLTDKITLLYVAASFDEDSINFTKVLMEFHKSMRELSAPLQIVLLPFGSTNEDLSNFMNKPYRAAKRPMPWLGLKPSCPAHQLLMDRYHSAQRGLPTLLVFAPDGTLVSNTGRTDVETRGSAALETWKSLVEAGLPWASPQLFDPFLDPATQIAEACTQARAPGRARRVMLHVGVNWSDWCVMLHKALEEPVLAEYLESQFITTRLHGVTSQRWLKEHLPRSLDAFPRLIVVSAEGSFLMEENVEELLVDE